MTVMLTIMLKRQFTRLWDAGYQKFLLTDEGQKIPALASHLENLRKCNEELRTALGVPTFYSEALGSMSQISVYDRVMGRNGAVPDDTVGAHRGVDYCEPRDCLLVRLHDLRGGTRNSTAKPGPSESLARKVRTDQAHSRGLGSKKSSGRCNVFS